MTSTDAVSDVRYCARHPKIETGLACGRCETPICPRCTVFTDVGARCPDCAPARKLPQFELGPLIAGRAALAAVASGGLIGAAWGLILPGGFGFFMIFLGIGIGYGVAETISWATNRKLGPFIQALAGFGVVLAYLTRNVLAGYELIPANDFGGVIAVLAGIVAAINRLRY
ncbi:MAG: B-box zinc finger protein [Dehalococcoidia bacterium]